MKKILAIIALMLWCASFALGQGLTVQIQNGGTVLSTFKKWLPINCSTGLTCSFSNGIITMTAAGGGSAAYPQTISGTVNSGGIPYFSSTSVQTSSLTLALGHFLLGGGTGGAPSSDATCDDGQTTANTVTCNGSGGIAASGGPLSSASDGVHPGQILMVGNTTSPTIAANTVGWDGPNTPTFAGYRCSLPATAPAGQVLQCAAPSSGQSVGTWVSAGGAAPSINNWQVNGSSSSTGGVVGGPGTTWGYNFWLPNPGTFGHIAVHVTVSDATAGYFMGVYNSAGTRVCQTATFTPSSTGYLSVAFTASCILTAGEYTFASAAPVAGTQTARFAQFPSFGNAGITIATAQISASLLPASLTFPTDTNVEGSGNSWFQLIP